jgi:hypothetical protein
MCVSVKSLENDVKIRLINCLEYSKESENWKMTEVSSICSLCAESAMLWLMRLLFTISLWRPGSNSSPVRVEFVADNVAPIHVLIRVPRISATNIVTKMPQTHSLVYQFCIILAIDGAL